MSMGAKHHQCVVNVKCKVRNQFKDRGRLETQYFFNDIKIESISQFVNYLEESMVAFGMVLYIQLIRQYKKCPQLTPLIRLHKRVCSWTWDQAKFFSPIFWHCDPIFDQRKPQVDFCLLMKAQTHRQPNKQTILYNKACMNIKCFLSLIYYKDKQAKFG